MTTREIVVSRIAAVALFIAVSLGLAAPVASATPTKALDATLGQLWVKIFETLSPQNPFGTGGAAAGCLNLGGTVAPFGPTDIPSCTVKPGTKIYIAASSFECSTFEGNGTTEAQLLECARQGDAKSAPLVTLDGKAVPVSEVETGALSITLPADNIFGEPAGSTGLSVAHGWVALVNPLTPGTHTIIIRSATLNVTTTIVVKPDHQA
jgi:hypothetical protein